MTSRSAAHAERRRWLAKLAALCAWLAVARARAEAPLPIELTWNAPAGCPKAEDVRARIRTLAGAPAATGAPLRAAVTIIRGAGGKLQLTLVVHAGDAVGERHLEGRSCDDLAGVAAVDLALLLHSPSPLRAADIGDLDHAADGGGPAPGKASVATEARATQPRPAAAPPAAAAQATAPREADEEPGPPSPRAWRALLQAPAAALGIGPAPRPSFGVAVAGGLWFERFRVFAEGTLWLRQALPSADPAQVGAHIDRVEAGLRACRTFPLGRLELAPCLTASVQHLWARGTGSHVAARTAETTWFSAGAGAQARLQLADWFSLLASVDAQLDTARPRIAIDSAGQIGQLGAGAVKITLGGEWIL